MYSSRRKEPFRYAFHQPLTCEFIIGEINGKKVKSANGQAELVDISKCGCKLTTPLHLNASFNIIQLDVIFRAIEQELTLNGMIKWQNPGSDTHQYGIEFDLDEEQLEAVLLGLRYMAGSNMIKAM